MDCLTHGQTDRCKCTDLTVENQDSTHQEVGWRGHRDSVMIQFISVITVWITLWYRLEKKSVKHFSYFYFVLILILIKHGSKTNSTIFLHAQSFIFFFKFTSKNFLKKCF